MMRLSLSKPRGNLFFTRSNQEQDLPLCDGSGGTADLNGLRYLRITDNYPSGLRGALLLLSGYLTVAVRTPSKFMQ